jgi:thiol-disulfide isomerase/thioredoxin
MTGRLFAILLLGSVLWAQAQSSGELSQQEQQDLQQVLSEGSSSPVDLIHALETHLAKYPYSPKRGEIERAILKAAMQANDLKRVGRYGERVLKADPDDTALLDPVAKALVIQADEEQVKAGLQFARHLQALAEAMSKSLAGETSDRARHKDEVDRLLGHALVYQAIALGRLGDAKNAADLARRSFETYPSVDPALELARRLAVLGQTDDAIRAYADAFTIPDPRATDSDRAEIRRRMGELYRKAKGSEAGLGDIVLQAYDRNAARLAERHAALKRLDPNLGVTNPMQFTLSSVNSDPLKLSTLAGKVVVMDFWATWCGPCRAQHPLYDEVKKRFARMPDVVFLAIDADEDRSLVKPFVEEQGWKNPVYYEDGLQRILRVSSIPTTVVFGKDGSIVSRMNGYNPESFVDVLTDRIREALRTGGTR